MFFRWIAPSMVMAICLGSLGCRDTGVKSAHQARANAAPNGPSTAPSVFSDKRSGIELTCPAGWVSKTSPDYVLLLVPGNHLTPETSSLSLDVPALPWHLPGMIPMRLVKNGYLDDLRKSDPGLKILEDSRLQLPKTEADRVHTAWHAEGKDFWEKAILMVHDDRVYILRASGQGALDEPTRVAFEAMAKSIKWIE